MCLKQEPFVGPNLINKKQMKKISWLGVGIGAVQNLMLTEVIFTIGFWFFFFLMVNLSKRELNSTKELYREEKGR